MNCDIVVAHYKENLEWVNKVNKDNIRHWYIYTKDDKYKMPSYLVNNNKVIHEYLPNIGRESYTYLKYCIDNYNNLADFVIFLQGYSAAHGVTLAVLNSWIDSVQSNSSLSHTKNHRTSSLYTGLKNGRRPGWGGRSTEPSRYPMDQWFKKYINVDIDQSKAKIYFGAVFGVSKDRILSRSLDEYKNILTEFNSINAEACHFIERSWYYWFNLHENSNR